MASNRSGHRPAGGINSRRVIHKPQPKVEPRARAMDVERVSQIGASTRFVKKPTLEAGRGYNPPVGPTTNLVSGPGGGRDIHKCGSQGQHGSVDRGMPSGMGSTRGEWPDD
jgi:hypothetical protein